MADATYEVIGGGGNLFVETTRRTAVDTYGDGRQISRSARKEKI